jgi:hypothetical protein
MNAHHVLWIDREGGVRHMGTSSERPCRTVDELTWLTVEGKRSLRGLVSVANDCGPAVGTLMAHQPSGATAAVEARALSVRLPDDAPGTLVWIGPVAHVADPRNARVRASTAELKAQLHTLGNMLAVIGLTAESLGRAVLADPACASGLADIRAAHQRAIAVLRVLTRSV